MMQTIIKNVNTCIRVKLNDEGRKIEKQYAHEMYKANSLLIDAKKEDEHGYTEWILWEFMSIFGEYCYNGAETFFDEILISDKDQFTEYCEG